MVSKMRIRFLWAAMSSLVGVVPGIAAAQDADRYQCTYGDLTRRIEIVRETGVLVPCEVHYYKDTEAPGEQQVLWRAQREEGYCEARADEFVEQLSDWGWSCSNSPDATREDDEDGDEG